MCEILEPHTCRRTGSSTSLMADVRPISRTSPSTCQKIKYSNRSDTRRSCPAAGDHQSSLVSRRCIVMEPRRVREDWEGFFTLVLERNGEQPDRFGDPTANLEELLYSIGIDDLFLTMPAHLAGTYPGHLFGIRYPPVPDLAPVTFGIAHLCPATHSSRHSAQQRNTPSPPAGWQPVCSSPSETPGHPLPSRTAGKSAWAPRTSRPAGGGGAARLASSPTVRLPRSPRRASRVPERGRGA
jgi:hypothetical protein